MVYLLFEVINKLKLCLPKKFVLYVLVISISRSLFLIYNSFNEKMNYRYLIFTICEHISMYNIRQMVNIN